MSQYLRSWDYTEPATHHGSRLSPQFPEGLAAAVPNGSPLKVLLSLSLKRLP